MVSVSVELLESLLKNKVKINICINGFWHTGKIKKRVSEDLWSLSINNDKEIPFTSKDITRTIEMEGEK